MSKTKQKRVVSVNRFSSFEEENLAEHCRLAGLTPIQRLKEFGILQERLWGVKWTGSEMEKVAIIEKLAW
jgi:hypothetical protein